MENNNTIGFIKILLFVGLLSYIIGIENASNLINLIDLLLEEEYNYLYVKRYM
jgi:hypothetical protein